MQHLSPLQFAFASLCVYGVGAAVGAYAGDGWQTVYTVVVLLGVLLVAGRDGTNAVAEFVGQLTGIRTNILGK